MKRTVVKAGMGRLAASALALTLAAIPALAGDRALIDYIGYSPDAKYFAFEEFGEVMPGLDAASLLALLEQLLDHAV